MRRFAAPTSSPRFTFAQAIVGAGFLPEQKKPSACYQVYIFSLYTTRSRIPHQDLITCTIWALWPSDHGGIDDFTAIDRLFKVVVY